jgi:hypothetical protein
VGVPKEGPGVEPGWFGNEKPKLGWGAEPVEAPMAGVEDEDEPKEKPAIVVVLCKETLNPEPYLTKMSFVLEQSSSDYERNIENRGKNINMFSCIWFANAFSFFFKLLLLSSAESGLYYFNFF